MVKQFDIVISGGAMAGATLALALNHALAGKVSIAIVESYQVDHTQHPGFDARAIALAHGTVEILRGYQLWESIQDKATAIKHIHVSDRAHLGMTEIASDDIPVPALGYVVELADVGHAFHQLISLAPNIELLCPDAISQITRHSDYVALDLDSGESLETKLLVSADGADSDCCAMLNLAQECVDFNQSAIIANIVCQQPHQNRAFERFTEHGPVALLPMTDNRMSLVWCLPPEQIDSVMKLGDEAFLHQLQQAFGWRLGALTATGQRSAYPLMLRYREQIVSHRFAVVGNAAQALHPIAGQGFNLGIRDVASLVDEIAAAYHSGLDDLGDYSILSTYQARRGYDRTATMALTSGLVRLFSNDWWSTRLGRNLGLLAADNLPPLKQPLLQRTLGLVAR
ncbi:2-octaprenyl-6-methoxyphenyl hydroxylase [Vibrio sp. WXL210]|uniref:2-octaprenyl-6-methoxyphenyl hydroxylase n=1 Tax=Vibrio sp. WXL210 TaxID=3450709 RepID=UPI003EC58CD9